MDAFELSLQRECGCYDDATPPETIECPICEGMGTVEPYERNEQMWCMCPNCFGTAEVEAPKPIEHDWREL